MRHIGYIVGQIGTIGGIISSLAQDEVLAAGWAAVALGWCLWAWLLSSRQ